MSASDKMTKATRRFIAAHCMLTLAALLGAQDVVLRAPAIDALWTGADGRLRAQCARRVVLPGDPVTSVAIPDDAIAFDHGLALAWATAAGMRVESGGRVIAREGAFALRREPGLPPLRAGLFLTDSRVLAPAASGVASLDWRTGETVDLEVRALVRHDRGFGLTGEVVDDLIVPHVFGFEHPRSGPLFVTGEGASFVRLAGGRRTPLPPVDLGDGAPLEGFEHVVPPLFADVDQDGVPDLVRVDAARGVVAIQCGLAEDPIPAPRVFLLKAPILSIDATDMTGDGRPELVVMRLPPLTPLQQLAILMQSKLSVTVLVYARAAGGDKAPAPIATIELSVGVKVVVRDQLRRAEIQDLVACAAGKVLVATPGGRARLLAAGEGAAELGPVPAGAWSDPLRPVRAGGSVFGVLRVDGEARLVRFAIE